MTEPKFNATRLENVLSDIKQYVWLRTQARALRLGECTWEELADLAAGMGDEYAPQGAKDFVASLFEAEAAMLVKGIPPTLQVRLDDPEEIPSGEDPQRRDGRDS